MGIRRNELDRMLAFAKGTHVHVRVDAPGTLLVDDQTIQGNRNASPTRQTIQSKRKYLCDASFAVVIVPGPSTSNEEIASAARQPVFSPFLGRKACVLSTPLLVTDVVEAEDPISLFNGVPRGPHELLEALGKRPRSEDFYLDNTDFPDALRKIPLRDDLAGPLPRQWRERFAVHVRRPILETQPIASRS
jgi:CRISPR-associated protein Cas5/CasD subtype I-E